MTRHEISQLKLKDKVVIQTGLYAGYIGVIEQIDLSAAFPNGSLQVSIDGQVFKVSGVEISRYMGDPNFDEVKIDIGDVEKDGWEFDFDGLEENEEDEDQND